MDDQKFYLADQKVKAFSLVEKKTPGDKEMVKVELMNGGSEEIPLLRFEAMRTFKASDATNARDRLVNKVSSTIYAIMHEYGVKLEEVDAIFNKTVGLINDGATKASNILWDVSDASKRDLIMINDILLKDYQPAPIQDEQRENIDGVAPAGGGAN